MFQLFFLKDDEEQSVEVKEVEEIDFQEVARASPKLIEDAKKPWYFTHI